MEAHLCIGCSTDSIQELLKVPALQGWCSLRAGQNGHEVGNGLLQVASFPEAAAQRVMNVLLNEAPILALVHAQCLPAFAASLRLQLRYTENSRL